jgi:hypothetical protein
MAIQRFPYLYQQAREENVSDGRGPFAGARDRCRFPSPGGETRYAWFDWWVSRAEQRPVPYRQQPSLTVSSAALARAGLAWFLRFYASAAPARLQVNFELVMIYCRRR